MPRCALKLVGLALLLAIVSAPAALAAKEGFVSIKFGILPVLDTLPLQVAEQEGYFSEQGLDVELVNFNSALERDMALQAGHLDGYFGDLIAAVLLLQNGVDMPVALTSYRTAKGQPMFGIATSPSLKSAALADLKGATIGYSKATIMEFLLDAMLERQGLGRDYFKRVEVKKVPIRMQMLTQSQLDCALLPEPLLSLVKFKGGGLAITAEDLDIPLTILGLDRKFFADGGEAYHKFTAAYAKAVAALAERPEDFRALMGRTCRVPPPLLPRFPVYAFPQPELPGESEVSMVVNWMRSAGMLKGDISYTEIVAPLRP